MMGIGLLSYKQSRHTYVHDPKTICENINNVINKKRSKSHKRMIAVNGERFAGLNFRIFCVFQEHHKSFPVHIIQALYNGVV